MPSGQSLIVGGGIQSGSPFTLNHLVYVTNTSPAQLSSYGPIVATDSGSSVVYTAIPDGPGNVSTYTLDQATLRVAGGIIAEYRANDRSVCIGPQASIGITGTTETIAIGYSSSNASIRSVAIGYQAAIGAGNDSSIAIGDTATVPAGTSTDAIAIGRLSVGGVAQGIAIGLSATVTQANGVVVGANSSVTAAAAQSSSIVVGAGTVITSTQSITIGAGGADAGANVLQLGAANTPIITTIIGAGNTIASPVAKLVRFTNASGTDNAANPVTIQAALSSGNALPGTLVLSVGQQVAGSSATLQTAGAGLTLSHTTAGGHLATFPNRVNIGATFSTISILHVTAGTGTPVVTGNATLRLGPRAGSSTATLMFDTETVGNVCVIENAGNVLDFYTSGASFVKQLQVAVDALTFGNSGRAFSLLSSVASGTDTAAGNLTYRAALSTGNATPGSLIFQVGQQVAGSSSTVQTAGTGLTLSHTTAGKYLATFEGGGGAGIASLRLNGLTDAAGANVGTLTNSPHTGNPAFWAPINIAGTVYCIPCFALT